MKKFRVLWSNEQADECSFGILTETFAEAELVLKAYHNMADFFCMNKDSFYIDGLDRWHGPNSFQSWRKIPSYDYEKYRVYE